MIMLSSIILLTDFIFQSVCNIFCNLNQPIRSWFKNFPFQIPDLPKKKNPSQNLSGPPKNGPNLKSSQVEIAQLSGIELVIASLKRFPTEPGVQEKLSFQGAESSRRLMCEWYGTAGRLCIETTNNHNNNKEHQMLFGSYFQVARLIFFRKMVVFFFI